jgi:hypothetical protein
MRPRWASTPRRSDRLVVGRNVTLTIPTCLPFIITTTTMCCYRYDFVKVLSENHPFILTFGANVQPGIRICRPLFSLRIYAGQNSPQRHTALNSFRNTYITIGRHEPPRFFYFLHLLPQNRNSMYPVPLETTSRVQLA